MKFAVKTVKFPRGETILRETDKALSVIYQILYGRVSIYRYKGSDIVEVDILRAGDFLGESSFFDGGRCNVNAEALDDVELMEIPLSQELTSKFESIDPLIQQVIRNLTKKNRRNIELIRKLQHFEILSYEHLKSGVLKSYHIKDFMRMCSLLVLLFGQLGKDSFLSTEDFENYAYILIQRSSIRVEDFFRSLDQTEIVEFDLAKGKVKLLDPAKLEGVIQYITKALRRKLFYIYIGKSGLIPLVAIKQAAIQGKGMKLEEEKDESGKTISYAFTDADLTTSLQENFSGSDAENIPNLQLLVRSHLFEKETKKGSVGAKYRIEASRLEEILMYQPIIFKLQEIV